MSLTSETMGPADIRACTCGNDGYGNGNGMWGGDWLAYLLLFALIGGGGFGFGGGFGGGGILPWLLFGNGGFGNGAPCATQADVRAAVDQQTLISKIDQQTYGLSDVFNSLNTNLNNNFRGIDNAICTLGYQGAQHASNLSAQLAQCCCDTRAAIQDVAYGNAMNTNQLDRRISECCCDIEKMNMQSRFDAQAYNCNTLQAIDKLGDRIVDHLNAKENQALRDEVTALRLAASQAKQNEYLISRLDPNPCPTPAYVVQPPQQVTFPTNCCGGVNYAAGGCGGCGSF